MHKIPSQSKEVEEIKKERRKVTSRVLCLIFSRKYMLLYDIVAITLTLALYLSYHIYYWSMILESNKRLSTGRNLRNARYWVIKHHSQADNNATTLLAVHTVRQLLSNHDHKGDSNHSDRNSSTDHSLSYS